jgi:hypothetical protein
VHEAETLAKEDEQHVQKAADSNQHGDRLPGR